MGYIAGSLVNQSDLQYHKTENVTAVVIVGGTPEFSLVSQSDSLLDKTYNITTAGIGWGTSGFSMVSCFIKPLM